MSETIYRLDKSDRVLSTNWGRVDKHSPSWLLRQVLERHPELAIYIVEKGDKEEAKAKVTRVKVTPEPSSESITMVEPKAATIEVEDKTKKKRTTSKK